MSGSPLVVIGHPRPPAAGPLRGVLGRLGVRNIMVVDGDRLAGVLAAGTPQMLLLHAGLPGFGPELLAGLRTEAVAAGLAALAAADLVAESPAGWAMTSLGRDERFADSASGTGELELGWW